MPTNMSYCRFENTAKDLEDCQEHLGDELSYTENKAKDRILGICCQIAAEYGDMHQE